MWPLILASLPDLIKAGTTLFDYIKKLRAAASQAGEWTPEMEEQFQGLLKAAETDPAWQPD